LKLVRHARIQAVEQTVAFERSSATAAPSGLAVLALASSSIAHVSYARPCASMRVRLQATLNGASANGEPTYENGGRRGRAAGWWQGHEAWCNLCAGGSMGVVYGAGSLWQWRLHLNDA
jgi:hypothetical protein